MSGLTFEQKEDLGFSRGVVSGDAVDKDFSFIGVIHPSDKP